MMKLEDDIDGFVAADTPCRAQDQEQEGSWIERRAEVGEEVWAWRRSL